MTTIENSGSAKPASVKIGRFRRAVMGAAFAAVGLVTLGTATTPGEAYWYHGYWHPNYAYYPYHYYGWYGHPAYYGWRWGWGGWGWRHGWGWHRW